MTRTIGLNPKDIRNLINDLNSLSKDIKKLPNIITEDLLIDAETIIMNEVEMSFKDGNVDIHVERTDNKVSLSGSQAVYFEYGTGFTGKSHDKSPHMAEINYAHSNRKEWNYKSKTTGKWTLSKGMVANMPVFKASLDINRRKIGLIKNRISEVLKDNDFH